MIQGCAGTGERWMAINIRLVTTADIAILADLERDSHNPWSAAQLETELELPHARLLTAELDGEIAGLCDLHLMLENAHVNELCVKKSLRRHGIGQALMAEALSLAAGAGCSYMTLEVREQSAAARRLYEKLGFIAVGWRAGFYQNPDAAALTMRKEIL